jgi:hypothetical protein
MPFAVIHNAILVPESRIDEAYRIMFDILERHLKPAAGKIVVKRSVYSQVSLAA